MFLWNENVYLFPKGVGFVCWQLKLPCRPLGNYVFPIERFGLLYRYDHMVHINSRVLFSASQPLVGIGSLPLSQAPKWVKYKSHIAPSAQFRTIIILMRLNKYHQNITK
jgi:hypothetical protein